MIVSSFLVLSRHHTSKIMRFLYRSHKLLAPTHTKKKKHAHTPKKGLARVRAKLNQFNSLRIWPFAFGSAAAVAFSGAAGVGPSSDTGSTRPRWRSCGLSPGAAGRIRNGRTACVRT